jgi:RNA polymerase sigma factor (sigma-70 family)
MQMPASEAVREELELPPGFETIYAAHYDFLWRCARRLGVDPGEVEDVVQDSFVIALRRFEDFDPRQRGRASSWLFAILRNVIRNRRRGDRRRAARLETYAASPGIPTRAPAADTEAGLAGALLDEFLATLDADKREAFVLAELEGMSGPELARVLGINRNTASSRLRAARQAFARHFDEPRERAAKLREVAGRERAPSEARARGLPAIALAAGYGAAAPAALGVGAGLLGSKLLAGLIVLGSTLGAALVIHQAPEPEPTSASPTSAPPQATLASSRAPKPRRAPSPETIAEAAEPAPAEPTAAAEPTRKRTGPTQLERLGEARQALLDGAPGRALELVGRQTFETSLEGRRIALELAALCKLERHAEVRERVQAWRAAHPGDPIAARLDEACPGTSQ